jgi:deoxyribonuclease V
MRIRDLHRWDITPKEAISLQRELAERVQLSGPKLEPKTVAGADIALDRKGDEGIAAVIVYSYPELEEVERRSARGKLAYPYIPGLLSFREAPILLEAFSELRGTPDVVLFDGQGIAHPRGLGLASHMGLWLGIPTIGCAKSRLIGEHGEPGTARGSFTELGYVRGGTRTTVGVCLRTRDRVKPIYVSPGHLIDLETSIDIVLGCFDRTRIPKPTREADRLVGQMARGELKPRSR